VIDAGTDRPVGKAIKVAHRPTAIAITPDGKRAYVTSMAPGLVSVIDTRTRRPAAQPIEIGPFPIALAVTPDGSYVYVVKN
jgi:YVTN family beta-propeller protein